MNKKNVFYVGVARNLDKTLIAKYSHNCKVDSSPVKDMLGKMQTVREGEYYHFSHTGRAWHVKAANGLLCVLSTAEKYPERFGSECLDEVNRQINAVVDASKWAKAKDGQLDGSTAHILKTICEKYDDLEDISKIHKLIGKVEVTKSQMEDNIKTALENCVQLENIEDKAHELESNAETFNDQARILRRKMWKKNLKMKLMIGGLVFAVLLITIITCLQTGVFESD
eukprot:CAMPEP_0185757820 /NCGR_PEP_ID=MMETSP1174-20130828/16328_1 /TAXON_ID=35687 /ORGANISM="Dictyocha speculum, Strain CCMP1381" /LENGTH=225 /DNA_ID=CAMNT_0028437377 /DNA_START=17 /DNA_END=694 /DNA_ORIENTATION=+